MNDLTARAAIENTIARYARSVDRKDWDALRDCFTEDCVDLHGPFAGSPAEFVAWVQERHAKLPLSIHHVLNMYIEMQDPLTALVETNFWAVQSADPEDKSPKICREVFGRYFDLFSCVDGQWKIKRRNVIYDLTRQVVAEGSYSTPIGLVGKRDSTDPANFSVGPQ